MIECKSPFITLGSVYPRVCVNLAGPGLLGQWASLEQCSELMRVIVELAKEMYRVQTGADYKIDSTYC